MTVNIVPMNPDHIPILARLERLCFTHAWSESSLSQELGESAAHFLVAQDESGVLGYIGSIESDGCYITNVAVFPQFRGQGVGTLLLKSLESEAAQRGCEFITLEVRKSNQDAIRLYLRLGYDYVGERKNFYSLPDEDAVIMTKQLYKDEVAL